MRSCVGVNGEVTLPTIVFQDVFRGSNQRNSIWLFLCANSMYVAPSKNMLSYLLWYVLASCYSWKLHLILYYTFFLISVHYLENFPAKAVFQVYCQPACVS